MASGRAAWVAPMTPAPAGDASRAALERAPGELVDEKGLACAAAMPDANASATKTAC